MDLVRSSIEKPVAVIVGVIMVVLFGIIGLLGMPYQLSPSVEEPVITVATVWPGATPYEVERDIIEEQENVLKGITGLKQMESSSGSSRGSITLRFGIETDVDDALLRVSNKLNEVKAYPENVDRPTISATGTETSPVIWTILKVKEGNQRPIWSYRTFFENEVRQRLERIEGVAELFIGGGAVEEMHVTVRPEKLAAYGLTTTDLFRVLRAENVNISAGTMGVGRRNYRIRTLAEFRTPADIEQVVIKSTGQRSVLLRDVATVSHGYEKLETAMLHNSKEGIAVGIKPEPGTNILALSDRAELAVAAINADLLEPNDVYLEWVYDQRPYISGAIDLVRRNIMIGGILAIFVLLIFLRSGTSTIVVATAIPISILGTFIVMSALGRNLNVVSLAGISFAVGMLVDNAIVVLENIDRHRRMGKSAMDSAYDGAKEVWGAILTSTVTTIAVFLPVVFIKEEAGQLFRDIAIAITSSVALSLLVSVLVIPMLSYLLFHLTEKRARQATEKKVGLIAGFGSKLSGLYMALIGVAVKNWAMRIITVTVLIVFALGLATTLFPKMEYLPQGNRNLVINILIPPPGLSYEESHEIGEYLFESVKENIGKPHGGLPGIKNMFYVGGEQRMLFGAISMDEKRVKEFIPHFKKLIFSIPGMFGISMQAGIFQTRLGRGRTIDVDFSGADINSLVTATGMTLGMVKGAVPEAQVRPIPSLEILYPEVRIIPDRERLKAAGMTAEELGLHLDVMMDGRKIGDFKREGQKKIDLIVKASENQIRTPEDLYRSPVVTRSGEVVPVSSLARIVRTNSVTEIRHLERERTVTLQVTPPSEMPLEEAMEMLEDNILPKLKASGKLEGINVKMSGAADNLTETRKVLQWNFLLAIIITYLLMSALFGNFIYPLIIMLTVPLAAGGGFLGLKLVNIFIGPQPLDILTMLGFVILIGIVVNNAILIIHQSLNNIRHQGMDYQTAVLESTRSRLRPIYMSAFTSIFGMLPLVLAPGPGSELYRGLGSVVLGGLALSTVFTVFVIPALLLFVIRMEKPGKA